MAKICGRHILTFEAFIVDGIGWIVNDIKELAIIGTIERVE
jgi:hypothetical protein